MTEEIKGIVKANPIALEMCCLFVIEHEEGAYLVISTERQASKDSIFVVKGQEMVISGSVLKDVKFKGVVITEQARIKMKIKDDFDLKILSINRQCSS